MTIAKVPDDVSDALFGRDCIISTRCGEPPKPCAHKRREPELWISWINWAQLESGPNWNAVILLHGWEASWTCSNVRCVCFWGELFHTPSDLGSVLVSKPTIFRLFAWSRHFIQLALVLNTFRTAIQWRPLMLTRTMVIYCIGSHLFELLRDSFGFSKTLR